MSAAALQWDDEGAGLRQRVQRLAALWRSVTSRPMHPVGCTCMGHFMIPAMNPRDMEADILDYMRGRYAAENVAVLVALLDAREAERDADTPLVPLRTWLLRLPEAGLEEAALDRFLTDFTATLESLKPTAAGRIPGAASFAPEREHRGINMRLVSFLHEGRPSCGVVEGETILVGPGSAHGDLKTVQVGNKVPEFIFS